jgi:hypothetical protein
MAETPTPQPTRARLGIILAPLIGFLSHVVVVAAAYLAPRIWRPPLNSGWDDLATIVTVLLGGEILIGAAFVIAAVVLTVRRKGPQALGLLGGWLIGLIVGWLIVTH